MSFVANLDLFINALYALGIKNWIISPGSRNAPIIARIEKHGGFNLFSVPDERSAAFIGLGGNLAKLETAIICTSGTAVANYYPAVCEAFFAQIPLLIITADRPLSDIDTWDGQMIRQTDIFKTHAQGSWHITGNLHLPTTNKEIQTVLNQLYTNIQLNDCGPLHVNIPLHEPIYKDVEVAFNTTNFIFNTVKANNQINPIPVINKEDKVLVFAGQIPLNELANWQTINWGNCVVLAEKTSNLNSTVPNWELGCNAIPIEFEPTILITIGKNWIHKSLKEWIKNQNNLKHIHISKQKFVGNPFKTKVNHWQITNCNEVTQLLNKVTNNAYLNTWQNAAFLATNTINTNMFSQEFNTLKMVFNANFDAIHLGNSMAIRIAGWLPKNKSLVFCNRGTSGIDGSVATAIGYALTHINQKVVCVVGDIGMLYEHNSLWVNPYPQNLQIVVLNNGKGAIFNWIKGPEKLDKAKDFVLTPHNFTLKYYCLHYSLSYSCNENAIGKSTQLVEISI